MNTCPSCGGIIGRDCFNPTECAWISEQQAQQHDRNHHQEGYDQGYHEGYQTGWAACANDKSPDTSFAEGLLEFMRKEHMVRYTLSWMDRHGSLKTDNQIIRQYIKSLEK